ncbi:MAG: MSHA pilin protein MshD [Oleiphilaceae bacterium]|jgi:MSHA pilin protein MshD
MKTSFLAKANKLRQTGVTLVELVISIIIISIAMVALMNAFSVSMLGSADPLWRNKTLKLAQLYLDEILAKNYDHATPVGGMPVIDAPDCTNLGKDGSEDRENFNDVDDYDSITNEVPLSLIASLDSSYSAYRISVDVVCAGDEVGAVDINNLVDSNQAKKITVKITPPGQAEISFAAYKGNF